MAGADFFHIGPQKAATSWVYACLKDHPDVAAPPHDTIHYYDMHYHRGPAWYAAHFEGDGRRFDPTYTYLRAVRAPGRIARDNPKARMVVTLRHPVERAFSHYWHEKKKGKIAFDFKEVLENYDLFQNWLEPVFYGALLERWLMVFPRDQIMALRMEEIADTPERAFESILTFYGLDPDHRPDALDKVINRAGPRRRLWDRVAFRLGLPVDDEYRRGMDPALRAELTALCLPEIERTEKTLHVDLAAWKN